MFKFTTHFLVSVKQVHLLYVQGILCTCREKGGDMVMRLVGNVEVWRETLEFEGKFFLFVHKTHKDWPASREMNIFSSPDYAFIISNSLLCESNFTKADFYFFTDRMLTTNSFVMRKI